MKRREFIKFFGCAATIPVTYKFISISQNMDFSQNMDLNNIKIKNINTKWTKISGADIYTNSPITTNLCSKFENNSMALLDGSNRAPI